MGGAILEHPLGKFSADGGRVIDRAGMSCVDGLLSIWAQNNRSELQIGRRSGGDDSYRELTAPLNGSKEGAFRFDLSAGEGMFKRGEELLGSVVGQSAFDSECSLSDGGEKKILGQILRDFRLQAKPMDAGLGKDQAVETFFVQFSDASFDVAANAFDYQIWPMFEELGSPSQAARGHSRVEGKLSEGLVDRRHEDIRDGSAFWDGGERQLWVTNGGQILQTMHGEIGSSVEQRVLYFLGEDADAAEFVERLIANGVAGGNNDDKFDVDLSGPVALDLRLYELRLPESEVAAARGDSK
jgi:hypothetical protein